MKKGTGSAHVDNIQYEFADTNQFPTDSRIGDFKQMR